MFRVICINNDHKPDGIPTSKWLELGTIYTVIQVDKIRLQGGMLGFKLEEISLADCFPYQYFAARRFALPSNTMLETHDMLERLLEEAKEEAKHEPIPA
jgi:hypothetical protein